MVLSGDKTIFFVVVNLKKKLDRMKYIGSLAIIIGMMTTI